MENMSKKPLWQIVLWAILTPVVAILITVFIAFAMGGFQWHLIPEIFRAFWILFLCVIALVAILMLLMVRLPRGAPVTLLLVAGFLFILSSWRGNEIAEAIRGFIDNTFDISLLAGGITVMGLALAIAKISRKEQD